MRRGLATLLTTAIILGTAPLAGLAFQAPDQAIDAVEEDWELVIETPDPLEAGPQVTTSMRPDAGEESLFIDFDLNYREYPEFHPGGLQIQVWSGDDCTQTATQGDEQLEMAGETINWTQRMSVSAGTLTYTISNGLSLTWGPFGQAGGQLSVSVPSPATGLSSYSPDDSATRSGVSWQSNRVTSLTLKQVRYYSAGVLVKTDTTPRTVQLDQ
jgi:hypothetical protein